MVHSEWTRSRLFSIRRSTSSLITRALQASCFLKLKMERGLLAMPGFQKMLLFSKVRALVLCFSLSDTLLDVCGKLEGEGIVGEAFQDTPKLWCIEEPPLCPSYTSQSTLSLDRDTSPNVIGIQIPSVATMLQGDWREPIRRMLRSLDLNICITAKPPGTFAYSATPSPISPVGCHNDGPNLADSRRLAPQFQ